MSLPVIAVIVPTIDGREDHYERCRQSYEDCAKDSYELEWRVGLNYANCGWGWQKAAEQMTGRADYVHFTCDDITAEPGWADAGIEALEKGFQPAPRTLNGHTGAPEYLPQWGAESPDWSPAGMSALPMISKDLWLRHVQPLLCTHYFSDNWISWRAENAGYQPRLRRGYSFKHWWADHKRGAGMGYEERMLFDQGIFVRAAWMAREGAWKEPWPPLEWGLA